jgi:hypothetical protein
VLTLTRKEEIMKQFIVPVVAVACLVTVCLATACADRSRTAGDAAEESIPVSEEKRKAAAEGTSETDGQMRYMPGEVLVKFTPEMDTEKIETLVERLRLEVVRVVSSPDLYLLRILDEASVEEVVERLTAVEGVAYAEPNYVIKID